MREKFTLNPERHKLPRGKMELLQSRLEAKMTYLPLLGVRPKVIVCDLNSDSAEPLFAENEDEPSPAASSNKLAVARYIVAAQGQLLVRGDTLQLLTDMLKHSDNQAAISLVGDNLDEINKFLIEEEYEATRLEPQRRDDGRMGIGFGVTTPSESLRLMLDLLQGPKGELTDVVRSALADTDSKYGIRPKFVAENGVTLFDKTGQYNADPKTPKAVRNVTALVVSPQAAIGVSVMNEVRNNWQAKIADMADGHFGADILDAVGGRGAIRRGIAEQALRLWHA